MQARPRTYYHYASDEMSSITHVVDDDKVLNHYEYDAWGNLTACEETVQNRFKFNGQQHDPISQQYYLRARYYNPVIGRFTQEDSYDVDGLNLYVYCRNNPVYYVDPSGHESSEHKYCKKAIEQIMSQYGREHIETDRVIKLKEQIKQKRENHKRLTPSEREAEKLFGMQPNKKNGLSYAKEYHDKRVNEIFDNPKKGRSVPRERGRRNYDAYYKGWDIEYKSDNFSKKKRTGEELDRMKVQVMKDISNKEEGLAKPHWHFENDPNTAEEMRPILKLLNDAEIPYTIGAQKPF